MPKFVIETLVAFKHRYFVELPDTTEETLDRAFSAVYGGTIAEYDQKLLAETIIQAIPVNDWTDLSNNIPFNTSYSINGVINALKGDGFEEVIDYDALNV